MRMKSIDAIFMAAIIITAVAALIAGPGQRTEPNMTEPKETVSQPTTATTTETTVQPTQEPTKAPTEATQPATEPTEPPEATEATEETTATEPQVILYDVPLGEDLQLYIIGLGERFGIDPAIIFAQIWKESRFNPNSVGDGGASLGLMQIQSKWHSGWMKLLNCPDLLDPYQNVKVGIHILADHYQRYGDIEMALVAYNAGSTGAYKNYFSKGVYSSKYSSAVMEKAEELRGEGL